MTTSELARSGLEENVSALFPISKDFSNLQSAQSDSLTSVMAQQGLGRRSTLKHSYLALLCCSDVRRSPQRCLTDSTAAGGSCLSLSVRAASERSV